MYFFSSLKGELTKLLKRTTNGTGKRYVFPAIAPSTSATATNVFWDTCYFFTVSFKGHEAQLGENVR